MNISTKQDAIKFADKLAYNNKDLYLDTLSKARVIKYMEDADGLSIKRYVFMSYPRNPKANESSYWAYFSILTKNL